jgi:hypothetical protein
MEIRYHFVYSIVVGPISHLMQMIFNFFIYLGLLDPELSDIEKRFACLSLEKTKNSRKKKNIL